jgi:hypothetical protein
MLDFLDIKGDADTASHVANVIVLPWHCKHSSSYKGAIAEYDLLWICSTRLTSSFLSQHLERLFRFIRWVEELQTRQMKFKQAFRAAYSAISRVMSAGFLMVKTRPSMVDIRILR